MLSGSYVIMVSLGCLLSHLYCAVNNHIDWKIYEAHQNSDLPFSSVQVIEGPGDSKESEKQYGFRQKYKLSLLVLSKFFDITDMQLELLIDLMTGNPHQIYSYDKTDTSDSIDFEVFQKNIDFKHTRIIILSEALTLSFNEVEKIGLFWIYNHNLMTEGKNHVEILARDIMGINPEILEIIKVGRYDLTQEFHDIKKQKIWSFLKGQLMVNKNT